MRSRKSGVRLGIHHIFFPPRFERGVDKHLPYSFVGNGGEIVIRFQEFCSERGEGPVAMSVRSIGTGGRNDECLMVRGDLLRLAGTRGIMDRLINRAVRVIAFAYIADNTRSTPKRVHDLFVCFSLVREEEDTRTNEGPCFMRAPREDVLEEIHFLPGEQYGDLLRVVFLFLVA